MRTDGGVGTVRERRPARPRPRERKSVPSSRLVLPLLAAGATALAGGTALAGSPDRIAGGVTVAGIEVGGLRAGEARRLLAERAERSALVPVVFTARGRRFRIAPVEVRARVDWAATAEEALGVDDWPLPVRGLKRLALRLFGAEVRPHAEIDDARLDHELDVIARSSRRRARDAALVLRGLEPRIVPEREGWKLDRRAAAARIVAAVTGFERGPVALPVRVERPSVAAADLRPVADDARTALSAPVGFRWQDVRWLVSPRQLAAFLLLPAAGSRELGLGGARADRYLALLARAVERRPKDARFLVAADGRVRVVAARRGRRMDVAATKRALLAAALRTEHREADVVVRRFEPAFTTRRARALGVERVLAAYSTAYAGTPDRIHNLRLAVSLLDGTRLRPGAEFSLNEIVGPRTEERGFRLAPTIMNGEYRDAVGGGVSQVATTVFNAAWEAGLKITARTPHSLYIARYPLGRDATVNYPDIDLRFENDTSHWIVVEGSYDDVGIAITLLGAPTGRRVVSETGELEEIAPPVVEKLPDPTLFAGETIVEDEGEPGRAVTVTRTVYERGHVLYDETWRTSYGAEPQVVRVGTRPRPPDPAPPRERPKKNEQESKAASPPPPTTTGG
jgi:vancomycin resistance protein YoaR